MTAHDTHPKSRAQLKNYSPFGSSEEKIDRTSTITYAIINLFAQANTMLMNFHAQTNIAFLSLSLH